MFCFKETGWKVNTVKQLRGRWKLIGSYANEQGRNAVRMALSNELNDNLVKRIKFASYGRL